MGRVAAVAGAGTTAGGGGEDEAEVGGVMSAMVDETTLAPALTAIPAASGTGSPAGMPGGETAAVARGLGAEWVGWGGGW